MNKTITPTKKYIEMICELYGDLYDDRIEDSRPGGEDWFPGVVADHKSMASFQRELEEGYGIKLSRSKIQKILITGGCWTTERSREVQELFEKYTQGKDAGGKGLSYEAAVKRIAEVLEISTVSVNINLPYLRVVYDLEDKSSNAKRIEWSRKRKNDMVS